MKPVLDLLDGLKMTEGIKKQLLAPIFRFQFRQVGAMKNKDNPSLIEGL